MTQRLPLPEDLTDWLATGDRAAEIDSDAAGADRTWWSQALAEHGFTPSLCGDRISRRDLFTLGAEAGESPEGALTLLWNVLAFCLGRKSVDTKRRIAAVAADRRRLGALLRDAALASREEPGEAYAMLRPDKGSNVIERLGPSGYTWYLYFAGAGEPHHPSQVFEAKVAHTLRRAGWQKLRESQWSAADYVAYSQLVDHWRVAAGVERNDVIVRGLFTISPPSGWDHPWQAWERQTWERANWVRGPLSVEDLRTVHHWLSTFARLTPRSAAAQTDFERIARTIEGALRGEVGGFGRGFDDGDLSMSEAYRYADHDRRYA